MREENGKGPGSGGAGEEQKKVEKPVSPTDELNQDLVFHYSRERRLERASPAVRGLYEDRPRNGRGIIQAFRANPSGAWVFLSIVIVAAFLFVYSARGKWNDRGGLDLGGNRLSVSALNFPGATYVLLKKTAASEESYTGPVDLALSIPAKEGEETPIETRRIFFSLEGEEDFRFSLPFEAPEIILVIRAGETLKQLRFKPD
jgi:hypothetical protein